MGWILLLAIVWLWACCSWLDVALNSEVEGEDFDWSSWDHWERAMLAPINVSWAILSGIGEAFRDR